MCELSLCYYKIIFIIGRAQYYISAVSKTLQKEIF